MTCLVPARGAGRGGARRLEGYVFITRRHVMRRGSYYARDAYTHPEASGAWRGVAERGRVERWHQGRAVRSARGGCRAGAPNTIVYKPRGLLQQGAEQSSTTGGTKLSVLLSYKAVAVGLHILCHAAIKGRPPPPGLRATHHRVSVAESRKCLRKREEVTTYVPQTRGSRLLQQAVPCRYCGVRTVSEATPIRNRLIIPIA